MKKRLKTGYFGDPTREKKDKIRIGREAPEDSVNIAYLQTPDLTVEENMSMTDDAEVAENIIPNEHRESIMIANKEGELEYVNYLGPNKFKRKDPGKIVPVKDFLISKRFYRDDVKYSNALFYRMEIDYHYDSMVFPKEDIGREIEYFGTQIQVADEFDRKIQNEEDLVYQIFVEPQKENPRICKVIVYLSKNTNVTDTFKIRYNHIDKDVSDEKIKHERREIQLYTGVENKVDISSNGDTKYLLESGKIRIFNGDSIYKERDHDEIISERQSGKEKREIYSISEDGDGYRVTVPELTLEDDRFYKKFNYRIMAEYEDREGTIHKYSSGIVTDVLMNHASILPFEERDYMRELKRIGIPREKGFVHSVKEMLDMSLPFGINGIPENSKIWIEDDSGDLLYYVRVLKDDENLDIEVELDYAYAVDYTIEESKMIESKNTQYIYENLPLESTYSIIPEMQEKQWDFEFEIDGEGYTEEEIKIEGTWKIGAVLTEKQSFESTRLDVEDRSLWNTIGTVDGPYTVMQRWARKRDYRTGRIGLTFLDNTEDVIGFYQTHRVENGKKIDVRNESNYEFSARVRMNDLVDDDPVGILFRVQSHNKYYIFAWEKDEILTEMKRYKDVQPKEAETLPNPDVWHGTGRANFTEHGYQAVKYSAGYEAHQLNELTQKYKHEFLTNSGFGENHKKIFKATPPVFSSKAKNEEDFIKNPLQMYPLDETNTSFIDITIEDSPNYNSKGWKPLTDYKITVVVNGPHFRVHITEHTNSKDKGPIVCEGYDEDYETGSYGIATVSQRWTYWDELKIEEVDDIIIYSDEEPHVFEKKSFDIMTTKTPQTIMRDKIQEYMDANPEKNLKVKEYIGADTDTTRTVLFDDYILAKPLDHMHEQIKKVPWIASEKKRQIRGKGRVTYHEDGYLDIEYEPKKISTLGIPEEVIDFKWKEPKIRHGHSVDIRLYDQTYIHVDASIPPLIQVGDIYHSNVHDISKDDFIKNLGKVFTSARDMREKFNIPENVNTRDLMLRIEKGHVTSVSKDGSVKTKDPNHLVNYRFMVEKEGVKKYPVDQHQSEVGQNRIRVSMLLDITEEEFDGYDVSIVSWTHLPNLRAYPVFAIKVEDRKRIQAELPRPEYPTQEYRGWHPRVKSGGFVRRVTAPENEHSKLYERHSVNSLKGEEIDLTYSIPEYEYNEHLRERDTLIQNESPKILNENTIKVKHENIKLEKNKNFKNIKVLIERDGIRYEASVSDVDAAKGIIYLNDDIYENDLIEVDYVYTENWYTYKGFTDEFDNLIEIDFNPKKGHYYNIKDDMLNLQIPEPLETHHNYSIIKKDSNELLAKTVYLYIIPKEIRLKNKESILEEVEKTIYHTFEYSRFDKNSPHYDPTSLLLARINLDFRYSSDADTILIDTRQRGGGIKKRVSRKEIARIDHDSLSNWDIGHWDGEPYQENGIVLIRVSDKAFEGKDEEEVKRSVENTVAKYKAYGVYPIVEYYSENEIFERMIIRNHNFISGEYCGYYNRVKSNGVYSIKKDTLGNYNDYYLELDGGAEFFVTIPGHNFTKGQSYEAIVEAKKESGSSNREAFTIYVYYKDGTSKTFRSGSIYKVNSWTESKQEFDYKEDDPDIKYVEILLGREKMTPAEGNYYHYNSVALKPKGKIK